jgi:hypothetical protein
MRVYPRFCPILYQLRPNQMGYVQIQHPKIVLETCDRCKRKEQKDKEQEQEQKHSWLKDRWATLSRLFRIKVSKHTPCEICQNYQAEEEQPLRIIPIF